MIKRLTYLETSEFKSEVSDLEELLDSVFPTFQLRLTETGVRIHLGTLISKLGKFILTSKYPLTGRSGEVTRIFPLSPKGFPNKFEMVGEMLFTEAKIRHLFIHSTFKANFRQVLAKYSSIPKESLAYLKVSQC